MNLEIKKLSKILIGFILTTAPVYRMSLFKFQIIDLDLILSIMLLCIAFVVGWTKIRVTELGILLGIYFMYGLISVVWSPSLKSFGLIYTIKIMFIALSVFFTIHILNEDDYKLIFVISGLLVFYLLFRYGDFYYGGIRYTIIVGKSYIDPNVLFPLYILPNVLFLQYLVNNQRKKSKLYKIILFLTFVVSIWYIFISGSRSALVAVAIAMILYATFNFRSPKILIISIVAIGILYFVLQNYASGDILARFTVTDLQESEGSGRVDIWKNVITNLKDFSILQWLFGNGINSAKLILGKTTHNMILELIVEYGLIGTGIFMSALIKMFINFIKNKDIFNLSVFIGFIFMSLTVAMNNMLIFWMYILYFYIVCANKKNTKYLYEEDLI